MSWTLLWSGAIVRSQLSPRCHELRSGGEGAPAALPT